MKCKRCDVLLEIKDKRVKYCSRCASLNKADKYSKYMANKSIIIENYRYGRQRLSREIERQKLEHIKEFGFKGIIAGTMPDFAIKNTGSQSTGSRFIDPIEDVYDEESFLIEEKIDFTGYSKEEIKELKFLLYIKEEK